MVRRITYPNHWGILRAQLRAEESSKSLKIHSFRKLLHRRHPERDTELYVLHDRVIFASMQQTKAVEQKPLNRQIHNALDKNVKHVFHWVIATLDMAITSGGITNILWANKIMGYSHRSNSFQRPNTDWYSSFVNADMKHATTTHRNKKSRISTDLPLKNQSLSLPSFRSKKFDTKISTKKIHVSEQNPNDIMRAEFGHQCLN